MLAGNPSVAQAEPLRIVMIGDSLTAGYGLPADEAIPPRLQAALAARGIQSIIENAGVSGDTTAGGRARLDWALGSKPDYVILELGGNDALRGLSPAETEANLDAMLQVLKTKSIKVLLAGMRAPPNLGRAYAQQFDAIYPRLAEKYGVPLYPFILDGVAGDLQLNQQDGIHPNAKGVSIIVARLLPAVQKFLNSK